MSERVPAGEMRVSDAQRRQVADRLSLAHDEGLIDLHEFDQRVSAAWQARTRADLDRVTPTCPGRAARPGTASCSPAPRAARRCGC